MQGTKLVFFYKSMVSDFFYEISLTQVFAFVNDTIMLDLWRAHYGGHIISFLKKSKFIPTCQ